MRKILVLVLVIGLLVGTFSAVEVLCEEDAPLQPLTANTWETENDMGGPVPYGGGGDGGGPNPG